MINGKLASMSEEDWDNIINFIGNLEFPLTIYRGINGTEDTNLIDPGIHWTVNTDLFKDSTSKFYGRGVVMTGTVDYNDIDWPMTVQHYLLYSLQSDDTGVFPENEITLKEGVIPNNIEVINLDEE